MTPIVRLFFSSSPAAIVGFVIPIVVDTIDGQVWRTLSHVSEEVIEDQPAVTDDDAATSIVAVFFAFWIKAPLLDVRPNVVGSGRAGFMGWGMAVPDLSLPFALEATAAGGVPARQIVADDDAFNAAIAVTQEAFVFGLGVRETYDGQATETLFWNGSGHV
jgi:hypothetical protein